MTLPFDMPAWVPAWVQLAILVVAVLVIGAFLLMPFSVFGVKARLEALDQRLDDLQSDIRELAHRYPDPEMRRPAAWRRAEADEDGYIARPARVPSQLDRDTRPDPLPRPPIPPAPVVPDRDRPNVNASRTRSEPTLRWPSDV